MKMIFLTTVLLFQLKIIFGQTCEQKLKTVIDGFNNFKSCSQRAEVNRLLGIATTVINECPVYYAENQDNFLKAKKYVEDTYEKLGCTNNGTANSKTNSNNSENTLLQNGLNALDKLLKKDNYEERQEKRKRENEEYEKEQKKENEIIAKKTENTMLDPIEFEAYCEFIKQEFPKNTNANYQSLFDSPISNGVTDKGRLLNFDQANVGIYLTYSNSHTTTFGGMTRQIQFSFKDKKDLINFKNSPLYTLVLNSIVSKKEAYSPDKLRISFTDVDFRNIKGYNELYKSLGKKMELTKNKESNNIPITTNTISNSTFKDERDNNVYSLKSVGTTLWISQNIRFKPINGGFADYDNNPQSSINYGRFYNWETAKNACPKGFRLPTSAELLKLFSAYGPILTNKNENSETTYTNLISAKELNIPDILTEYGNDNNTLYWTSDLDEKDNNRVYAIKMIKANEGYSNTVTFSTYPKTWKGFCRCVKE